MERDKISKAFAKNLRRARKERGLTQIELAAMLGYSSKAISKWESGEAIAPAVLLPELASCLQIDVNFLLHVGDDCGYCLGIDGGGTKTEFLLARQGGDIVKRLELGGCNPNDIGMTVCTELLQKGISEICRNLSYSSISLFAGIAGCLSGNNRQKLLQFFSTFGFQKYDCNSDALNAVSVTLGTRNGVMIIAGTGNVTFVQKDGVRHKLGGFNYLFEDGGSGYMLGRDALKNALKSEENGKTDSKLYRLILAQCATPLVSDRLASFYEGGKRMIASFAPLVFAAAEEGDPCAMSILERNAAVLAEEIEEGVARLGEEDPEVVLIGGLMRRESLLMPLIKNHLTVKCRLRTYTDSLAVGALYLAGWEE